MLWIAICGLGAAAASQLEITRLPEIDVPRAAVVAEHSALSAREMENLVGIPLENALVSVEGVREIKTIAKDEIVSIELLFAWNSDIHEAATEIGALIDAIYPALPSGMRKPVFFFENAFDRPMAMLAVIPTGSLLSISGRVTHDLVDELRRIEGIGTIRIIGAVEPEIDVAVDPQHLSIAALSLPEVATSIGLAISERPVGRIVSRRRQREVIVSGDITVPSDLGEIPIVSRDRATGRLVSDVARISFGHREYGSLFMIDGQPAIGMMIFSAGNALKSGRLLQHHLPDIRERYADLARIEPISIEADEIASSFFNLLLSLGLAVIACVFSLMVLLHSTRLALIVATSIPASVLGCLLLMRISNLSLNITSMSGIAIGIGMIVDNSIVIVERLRRVRATGAQQIAECSSALSSALSASTITTILVFAPLIFVPGISGALFGQLALTIIYVLLLSLAVACTLVPALYTSIRSLPDRSEPNNRDRLETGYRALLQRIGPGTIMFGMSLLLLVGVGAFVLLPKSLMPREQVQSVEVDIEFINTLSAEQIIVTLGQIHRAIKRLDGIGTIIAESGYDHQSLRERGRAGHLLWLVRMQVGIIDGDPQSRIDAIRRILERPDIEKVDLHRPLGSIEALLGFADSSIYRVVSENRSALIAATDSFIGLIGEQFAGSTVDIDAPAPRAQVEFRLDRTALEHHGLDARSVTTNLRAAIHGTIAAHINLHGVQIPIRVRLNQQHRDSLALVQRMHIPIDSRTIPITSLGRFETVNRQVELYRYNRKPAQTLRIAIADDDRSALGKLLRSRVDGEMVSDTILGQQARHIGLLFLLAIVLIYLVLGAQLESVLLPVPIIGMLLPAVAGSIIALLIAGKGFNLNSALGIQILIGTSINGAIILVTAYRHQRDGDIIDCSVTRLRSIAATLCTTLIALAPIVLIGGDRNPQADSAVAVIGGLTVGTAVTMLVIPMMFRRIARHSLRNDGTERRG